MELGSWALIHGPSLLGLIPLVVYIVLSFAIQDSIIIPISIATIVGFIMSGNGAVAFGTQFGATMGSTMGQVCYARCRSWRCHERSWRYKDIV